MKRTITEIIVEVEETVAVRVKEKSVAADESAPSRLKDERPICPACGQPVDKIIEPEAKNALTKTKNTLTKK